MEAVTIVLIANVLEEVQRQKPTDTFHSWTLIFTEKRMAP
jgi:hypothetical protein